MLTNATKTVSTILTFLLAMVLHPEVQKKGQAEVDAAVDLERLPEFMDFDRMPYVNAIILECLRWIPVLPMSKRPLPYLSCELLLTLE
jgi:cytochrome P450